MTNAEMFAARLARIEQGGSNTKNTIFVGQDEQHTLAKKVMLRQSNSRTILSNASYPLSLIAAFGLGLFAVALANYARFHLMAGQPLHDDADLEMALSGAIGIALSFVLAQMFRLTSKEHKAMQGAGVFVMICAFHNFAHWAPRPMSTLFSPEWVQQIQTESPPNSARFRGIYLPLFEKGSFAAEAAADSPVDPAGVPTTDPATAACASTQPTVTVIEMDNAKKKRSSKPATAPCGGG